LGLTTIAIFSGYQFLPSIITGNPALIYVGLAGPLLALNVILSHSVQAQGQVILAFVTSGLSHSAVFIILFVLFDPANARDLAFYYLIATLVVTLHLILQNYRFLKRVDQSSAIGYASPGRSAQFFVVQIGLELSVQSPVLLLGLLQHSSAEIAGYAIASRAALILSFVYAVTNRIVMPQFSQHYAQKSWLELKKDFSRSIMIMSTIAVPIAIAILILSKDLLAFFGGEFKRFSVALWILVLGQTIHVLTGPAGNLLLMADRHVLFRNLVFVGLILTVLVNIALIPELGAVGAAIALLVGYGFINISSLVFAWRLLRDLEHE
jgi:O-antigen/teichoic acid export membrane protein